MDLPFMTRNCELDWMEYLFKQFPYGHEPMSMKKALQEDKELEEKERRRKIQKELDDMYKKFEEEKIQKEKKAQERINKILKEHEQWMNNLLKYFDREIKREKKK